MRRFAVLREVLVAAAIAGIISALVALSGCSSCSRLGKSIGSDMSGGLSRKVTLYGTKGDVIDAWEGKIDLAESNQSVWFELNGKRVVIYGGIVVVEEL